ncbi:F-box/FBD/LRR-repeat protein At1g13570-like [Chenopodium quinoa]|uniref:F-box/FBD/LRR-repeat protein At1g13570-like n=1 Tax=Chenopodium quinoa TaxID=63459 RepID=UPI000B77EF08|nr:F-box/FBD/LRR-repeat protein At1g13570-like [Chenopodium quinoa]
MSAIRASINNRSCGTDADRISNLPPDLTHKILERLPLKEAAKTSVLSQHWRFQWASIPQIILDESFCESIQEGRNDSAHISLIYSNILLSHVGPISKFVLYVPSWFPGETFMWIRSVCTNDVKAFTLVFATSLPKNLPTCVFSCSGLTHLTLIQVKLLSLPPTFIENCIDTKMLESVISRCPQLESLNLTIYEPANLTIHAPKLKDLILIGYLYSGETHMWIRRVCANDVKEFTLVFAPDVQKNLPSCMFSCSGLTHLTLTGYKFLYLPPAFKGWTDLTLFRYKLLDLPSTFKGFPHLIYLKLYSGMRVEAKVLETLISWCPQLESLHLMC